MLVNQGTPPKFIMEPKNEGLEHFGRWFFLFKGVIFMFHFNFQWCRLNFGQFLVSESTCPRLHNNSVTSCVKIASGTGWSQLTEIWRSLCIKRGFTSASDFHPISWVKFQLRHVWHLGMFLKRESDARFDKKHESEDKTPLLSWHKEEG